MTTLSLPRRCGGDRARPGGLHRARLRIVSPGAAYTDLKLHDVGAGDAAAEQNGHGRGTSYDTPSLRALWLAAPHLHDGSARTLADVFTRGAAHELRGSVSADELNDLVAFLRSL